MKMLSYLALVGVMSFSEVEAVQVKDISCTFRTQECLKTESKLKNYSDALKDPKIAAGDKIFSSFLKKSPSTKAALE